MTYDATEQSTWDGQPAELYEFRLGASTWRYTSADAPVVLDGWTYESVPIERSKIEQGNEINRANLNLKTPRDNAVANLFLAQPPGGVVSVTVKRLHRSDGDGELIVAWLGRVLSVSWSGSDAVMDCEPVWTSVKQLGLRRLYNKNCPYVLYSVACGVNQLSYQLLGTVSAVSGLDLDVPGAAGQPDGYYTAGFVVWNSASGVQDTRWIVEHTGTTLTLAAPLHGIAGSDPVEVYPGCDRTLTVCTTKFSNTVNYGGFPYLPDLNPFETKVL